MLLSVLSPPRWLDVAHMRSTTSASTQPQSDNSTTTKTTNALERVTINTSETSKYALPIAVPTPKRHVTSPQSTVMSAASTRTRTESTSVGHDRRLSSSSLYGDTPTSAASSSSLISSSHLRQLSTDSVSSVSSNSTTPPSAHERTPRRAAFNFESPARTTLMEDVVAAASTPRGSSESGGRSVYNAARVTSFSLPASPSSARHGGARMEGVTSSLTDDSRLVMTTSTYGHGPVLASAPGTAFTAPMLNGLGPFSLPMQSHAATTFVGLHPTYHLPASQAPVARTHTVHVTGAPVSHVLSSGPSSHLSVTSSTSSLKRGQGFSCHHCKTHKMPEMLLFCSNQSKKGPGKKRCRKKYCDSCLRRLYGYPADRPLSETIGFQCPACLGNCVCAGCERKSAPTGADGSEGGQVSSGSGDTPPSDSPIAVRESASPDRDRDREEDPHDRHYQPKPTTPHGRPPGKKRRTSIDTGSSPEEARADMEDGSANEYDEPVTTTTISGGSTVILPDRRHSTEFTVPILAHAHSLPFTSSSPPLHTMPPRAASSSTTTSPRLNALSASRMIHIPAFSLHSPINSLQPTMTINASGIFSPAIHHSVSLATSAAAASHSAFVSAPLTPDHAPESTHALTSSMESTSMTSTHSHSSIISPAVTHAGATFGAAQRVSAFSPVSVASNPSSAPHTPMPMQDIDMDATADRAANGTNGTYANAPSPAVSPSLMKRLLLNGDAPSAPAASTGPGGGGGALIDRPHKPLALVATAIPPSNSSEDLMKVLANVACTVTSSALPPTHPPAPAKSDSSPKPTIGAATTTTTTATTVLHTNSTPAAASLAPTSSLASISAMKAQHAMEVQCLLQQQQQQLAELEMRAMKELEVHHQQLQQHQAQSARQHQHASQSSFAALVPPPAVRAIAAPVSLVTAQGVLATSHPGMHIAKTEPRSDSTPSRM